MYDAHADSSELRLQVQCFACKMSVQTVLGDLEILR